METRMERLDSRLIIASGISSQYTNKALIRRQRRSNNQIAILGAFDFHRKLRKSITDFPGKSSIGYIMARSISSNSQTTCCAI
jgi:hypothetical protein